jgi:hypothetical protein
MRAVDKEGDMARPAPPGKGGAGGGAGGAIGQGEERGLRPLSLLVLDLLRPALDRQGRLLLELKALWPLIAGERAARLSAPRRLQQGTLTLSVDPSLALELQHRTGELLARISAQLGTAAVSRIRLVQDRSFLAAAPAPLPPPVPRPLPPAALPSGLAGLPAGEVKEALVRLAQALYHERGK